jgi:hypothetical protein
VEEMDVDVRVKRRTWPGATSVYRCSSSSCVDRVISSLSISMYDQATSFTPSSSTWKRCRARATSMSHVGRSANDAMRVGPPESESLKSVEVADMKS